MTAPLVAEHVCEPDGWPATWDDRWTCPECLRRFEPFRVQREHVPPEAWPHLQPWHLGWVSSAPGAAS